MWNRLQMQQRHCSLQQPVMLEKKLNINQLFRLITIASITDHQETWNEQRWNYKDELKKGLGLAQLFEINPFVCMIVKKVGAEELWHLIDTQQMTSDFLMLLELKNHL